MEHSHTRLYRIKPQQVGSQEPQLQRPDPLVDVVVQSLATRQNTLSLLLVQLLFAAAQRLFDQDLPPNRTLDSETMLQLQQNDEDWLGELPPVHSRSPRLQHGGQRDNLPCPPPK